MFLNLNSFEPKLTFLKNYFFICFLSPFVHHFWFHFLFFLLFPLFSICVLTKSCIHFHTKCILFIPLGIFGLHLFLFEKSADPFLIQVTTLLMGCGKIFIFFSEFKPSLSVLSRADTTLHSNSFESWVQKETSNSKIFEFLHPTHSVFATFTVRVLNLSHPFFAGFESKWSDAKFIIFCIHIHCAFVNLSLNLNAKWICGCNSDSSDSTAYAPKRYYWKLEDEKLSTIVGSAVVEQTQLERSWWARRRAWKSVTHSALFTAHTEAAKMAHAVAGSSPHGLSMSYGRWRGGNWARGNDTCGCWMTSL